MSCGRARTHTHGTGQLARPAAKNQIPAHLEHFLDGDLLARRQEVDRKDDAKGAVADNLAPRTLPVSEQAARRPGACIQKKKGKK